MHHPASQPSHTNILLFNFNAEKQKSNCAMEPTFLPEKEKLDEKRIDIQSLFNVVRTSNKQPFIK